MPLKLFTILLLISSVAKGQVCCVLYTPVVAKDSMRVQHYITAADTVAGWSHCYGDPSTATRSVTGGNSHTITYSTLNTSYWGQSGGASIGANNGYTPTNSFPYATGVLAEGVLNTNASDTTKHLCQFSGLKPSTSYKIILTGTTQYNFNFAARYNVAGSSWQSFQYLNNNHSTAGTTPNPLLLTWTLNSSSTGVITISFGADPGTSGAIAGLLNALTITEQ